MNYGNSICLFIVVGNAVCCCRENYYPLTAGVFVSSNSFMVKGGWRDALISDCGVDGGLFSVVRSIGVLRIWCLFSCDSVRQVEGVCVEEEDEEEDGSI